MHGRVKVRTTAEQEAIKKKERAEKLVKYRAGINIIFQKRKDKVYDDEMMLLTERMLIQNPDIYTLWNIRREAFTENDWDEKTLEERHKHELNLTENCLRENPKSYYVWHQRLWIMDRIAEPDWKKELMLCGKCLNLDERNFHCWDYREFLVKKANISDDQEFQFSTTKILSNFSNYSSWHYRSRILSKIFNSSTDQESINQTKKEELELVMNATFTDPSDSSAWFYQRWLLDSREIRGTVWRVLVRENRAIVTFDSNVNGETGLLSLYINGNKVSGQWKSINGNKFSSIWLSTFAADTLPLPNDVTEVRLEIQEQSYMLSWSENATAWIYKAPNDADTINCYNKEQLCEQLSSYKQLSEMEPNNKWALLTELLLMRKVNRDQFHNDILLRLETLMKVDHLRVNYYRDLRSKYVIDYVLNKLWKKEEEMEISSVLDLSDLALTTLVGEQYFIFFNEVNLGNNAIANSLSRLSTLQSCEKLSLSSNGIKSLIQLPSLPKLQLLSLRNNHLSDPEDIIDFVKRHEKLRKLDLRDNPVYEIDTARHQIAEACPGLNLYLD